MTSESSFTTDWANRNREGILKILEEAGIISPIRNTDYTFYINPPPPRIGRFVTEWVDADRKDLPPFRAYGERGTVEYVANLFKGWTGLDVWWEEAEEDPQRKLHSWRKWAGYESDKPYGVKDPCGGCGKAKAVHPY